MPNSFTLDALIYILDDELACLEADLTLAIEAGSQDLVTKIEESIHELLEARTKLKEHHA